MNGDEVAQLRAEVVQLRAELADLKKREPQPTVTEPRSDRRGFLRLAGAASAGAVGMAVAGGASPAAAATSGSMIIGTTNSPSSENDTTALFNPSLTVLMKRTLRVGNYSNSAVGSPDSHRVAVLGYTSGADSTNGYRVGIYGRAAHPSGAGATGVFGSAGGVENPWEAQALNLGVVGTADGVGVAGHGTGVLSTGVLGVSTAGYDVAASGTGRVFMTPGAAGAPAAGSHANGEMVRDANGDLYLCVTSGSPGVWRKVAAQHPSYAGAGGSSNLLAKPIRLLDTRGADMTVPFNHGGAKIAAAEQVVVQVTGTVAQGLSVPAGAVGVFGNVTALNVDGKGWVTVWAGGPVPSASTLNYNTTHTSAAIANSFVSALSGAGALTVMCSSTAAHVLVDIAGFYY